MVKLRWERRRLEVAMWLACLAAWGATGCGSEGSTAGDQDGTTSDGADGSAGGDAAYTDGVSDTAAVDAATSDTAMGDGQGADLGVSDAGVTDTQPVDGGAGDSAASDASPDAQQETQQPGPNSCVGLCGLFNDEGSCACDSSCIDFGDCCDDYVAACQCNSDADCDKSDLCAPEMCQDGECVPDAVVCDDNDDCTDDNCDPATGKCDSVPSADGTVCDGGVACKEAACKAGKCIVGGDAPDMTSCEDGNPCTDNSVCIIGSCGAGDPLDCDDMDACTSDSCDIASGGCVNKPVAGNVPCDDGNACTTNDACVSGACQGKALAAGASCDDGNPCTLGGTCQNDLCETSDAPDGTPCDDGDICTSKDACVFGQCTGDASSCDDQEDCTEDACDAKTGACTHTPQPDYTPCEDGDPCTFDDECASAKCMTGQPESCDDGNPCTADLCDGSSGFKDCVHTDLANGDKCDDGDICSVGETCQSGVCVGKAGNCQVVFANDIPCGDKTWTMQSTGSAAAAQWAIDGTPDPPQPKSGACTLNFNNGLNYDDGSGTIAAGTATSAPIALPASGKVRLAFWQWHDVEPSTKYDVRSVLVSVDDFATTALEIQMDNLAQPQQWSLQTVALDGLQGKTIRVRFVFDSIDDGNNSGSGWFVDDIKVEVLP